MRERMGSGGPRGLQILRSGANRVRGGFDSHAFPPCIARAFAPLAALLALALVLVTPVHAQNLPAPDSTAFADTAKIVEFPRARMAAATRATPPPTPTGFDQPRWVMLRSLVVPGWGQLHNGSWTKALGVAAGEAWLGIAVINDQRDLDRLARAADRETDAERHNDLIAQYNQRLNDSTRNAWLLGGVVVYSLLDAYIDAHFSSFDIEFQNDPAMPAETGTPGQRVNLRWHF